MNDTQRQRDDTPTPTRQGRTGQPAPDTPVYRPLADIAETGEGVTVRIEMPGVTPDDVEISVERRVLTVRGRGRVHRPEGYRLVYAEYEEGDYERSFALGQEIDEEKIAADMRDGVLTLVLPRAEAAKPRKIQVKPA